MPELLAIMGGDWTPMQKVHPSLQNFVKELTENDTSQQKLEKVSDEIMEAMNESLNERNLPEHVKAKVKPGYEITTIAKHTFRKHLVKLLQVILSDSNPTAQNPHPFAMAIKDWCSVFVKELISMMSQALVGGVSDATLAIQFFLQEVCFPTLIQKINIFIAPCILRATIFRYGNKYDYFLHYDNLRSIHPNSKRIGIIDITVCEELTCCLRIQPHGMIKLQ